MVAEPSNVSEKKRTANRRNARKSTGPRSEEGKARSSQNARTHGMFCKNAVFDDEDAREFNEIRRNFIARLRPQDPLELSCVERVAQGTFRLMRLDRQENEQHEQDSQVRRNDGGVSEESMLPLAMMLMDGRGRAVPSAVRSMVSAATKPTIDPYGPARTRVEQSISRALRELRVLQSPNRPADLPEGPYLQDEEEIEAENLQNEPTNATRNVSYEETTTCSGRTLEEIPSAAQEVTPPSASDSPRSSPDAPSDQT